MEKGLPPLSFFVTIFFNLLPLLPVVTSFLNDPQPNNFKIIALAAKLLITFLSMSIYNGRFNNMSDFTVIWKRFKHIQRIHRQFSDKLFVCVWSFCGIGAYRVKYSFLRLYISYVHMSYKGITRAFSVNWFFLRWKFQIYYLWSFTLNLPSEKIPYSILSLLCL